MTEAEALAQLVRMTASTESPVLSSGDLEAALDQAERAAGSDPLWNLYKAAALAWRWKQGRVATSYSSTTIDGQQSPDSFKFLNAQRMADYYEGLASSGAIWPATATARFGMVKVTGQDGI